MQSENEKLRDRFSFDASTRLLIVPELILGKPFAVSMVSEFIAGFPLHINFDLCAVLCRINDDFEFEFIYF